MYMVLECLRLTRAWVRRRSCDESCMQFLLSTHNLGKQFQKIIKNNIEQQHILTLYEHLPEDNVFCDSFSLSLPLSPLRRLLKE